MRLRAAWAMGGRDTDTRPRGPLSRSTSGTHSAVRADAALAFRTERQHVPHVGTIYRIQYTPKPNKKYSCVVAPLYISVYFARPARFVRFAAEQARDALASEPERRRRKHENSIQTLAEQRTPEQGRRPPPTFLRVSPYIPYIRDLRDAPTCNATMKVAASPSVIRHKRDRDGPRDDGRNAYGFTPYTTAFETFRSDIISQCYVHISPGSNLMYRTSKRSRKREHFRPSFLST